ncbi:D-alanyl-D-alanine carboxypeptidase [Streptomyces actuosus]|uniref:D-alanyl-D-alanine carboxypeptidase n=1 Tax=Streptomyces actuosus TaxID=1885 RepID=A0ABS2VPH4_STRAS|nr:D-alanyl-D-alanine carboxypeptidase [Streptomyces actuosus]MBN0044944.1 D-alanyl-D-alanine carboxypeptidase [Streptomyces actuosus]
MEEASVAGESPDRSKQRESSAEPTPGSALPVPEARAEERRETRDPRLAMSREDVTPAAPGTARGSVDTATKILSVRDLAPDAGDPADAASGGNEDDGRSAASGGDPEAGETGQPQEGEEPSGEDAAPQGDGVSTQGDERLRSAVAQWIASANGTTPESGPDADAPQPGPDAGTDEGRANEADREAADQDTGERAERTEPGEDRADGRVGADRPADEAAETERSDRPEASEASEEVREPDEDRRDATGPADSRTGTLPADEPDQPEPDRTEADEATDESTGEADGTTVDDRPRPGEDAGEEADAVSSGTSVDEEPTGEGTDDHAGRADAEADADEGEDGDGGQSADKGTGTGTGRAVDQPTTMLKLDRPVRPAVDQPTAMLKLGETGRRSGQDDRDGQDDRGERAGQDDRGSERTSRFVALKPLDEPPARASRAASRTQAEPPASDATDALLQIGPERTTRQPLPPKPPLDLLAELTNTPPPPQTPLRTLVRRVKIWTPLVLLLVIAFAVVQVMRPLPTPTLTLTAEDTYSFEGDKLSLPWPDEGQGWMAVDGVGTMDHFGEQKPVAIGSVAKTMTAYVILRDHPLKPGQEGPKIEVDPTAEKEGGYYKDGESTLNTVKAGDFLTQKQALSAIMIPSANNIARLLARWDAGSEEAFVEKMNAAARDLGMTGTTYTDPSGLKETTVSTAEDQVKLGRAVVRIPALVDITSAASWTDPSGHYHNNYNELPYLVGAIGIKTGSTTAAGGNLLFASRRNVDGQTVTVVGAILGQNKPTILKTVNAVSKTALLAAQSALTSAKIVKKGDVVGYVDDGLGGRTPVVITEDVTAVGWTGMRVKLSFVAGEVPHTAKAGTTVGTLTVGDGGAGSAVKVPVALQKDLAEPGFADKLTRLG